MPYAALRPKRNRQERLFTRNPENGGYTKPPDHE